MTEISETIKERGNRYGNYLQQTRISDALSRAVTDSSGNAVFEMETDQRDAISMIIVKLSRILNGDPDYIDNWTDIAGYAKLVADRLENENGRTSTKART
jgi:hypothetical protein